MSAINTYGWWPSNREPPILIRSVAGFDQLAPEGRETDRVIANEMVSSLAGFYGNLDGHEKGSKECPMFFNRAAQIRTSRRPEAVRQGLPGKTEGSRREPRCARRTAQCLSMKGDE